MVEFKYELRDRYGFGVFNTPSHYDDCNSKFLITHDLDYKRGGLIHARHDESHDSFDCLACAGFQSSNVCDEPQINPYRAIGGENERNEGEKLIENNSGIEMESTADRGDLPIHGFWDRSTDCTIYVRICDVNQTSYQTRKPTSITKSTENDKKKIF